MKVCDNFAEAGGCCVHQMETAAGTRLNSKVTTQIFRKNRLSSFGVYTEVGGLEEPNIKIGEMDFTTSQSQKESSIGHSLEGKRKT